MRTRLGGIVSDIAQEAESSDTRLPSSAPRLRISGSNAGEIAAMSAALEPEMPETRYIAPSSTYSRPPRMCPSSEASALIIALASPVISMSEPRNTNSGTANKMIEEMPSSIRLGMIISGVSVQSAR